MATTLLGKFIAELAKNVASNVVATLRVLAAGVGPGEILHRAGFDSALSQLEQTKGLSSA